MLKIIEKLKKLASLHIVGISGMEGGALAEYFAGQGFTNLTFHDRSLRQDFAGAYKNYHDYQTEKQKEKSIKKILNAKATFNFGDDYLNNLKRADLIFVPATWFRYEENYPLKEIEGKITFSSITELYFQIMEEKGTMSVGVTGTNGKSTTTRLIFEILKKAGKEVYISGNDRQNPPILNKMATLSEKAIVVLEIMNRQLIGLKHGPKIAVVTNIAEHHLDDHPNFEDYVEVKKNIIRYQKDNDFAVLNFDNQYTKNFAKETKAKVFYFSLEKEKCPGIYLKSDELVVCEDDAKINLFKKEAVPLLGTHNLYNIAAAILTAYLLQTDREAIRAAVKSFKPLKHRLEEVALVEGVRYINDSQSTNPTSTVAALDSFTKPLILIAGGRRKWAKNTDFREMVEKFFAGKVKAVLLIGEVAPLLKKEFFIQKKNHPGVGPAEVKSCEDLAEAVTTAAHIASSGEIVLLSPGAESFGEFKDYRDRGEKFRKLVNQLK